MMALARELGLRNGFDHEVGSTITSIRLLYPTFFLRIL